MRSLRPHHVVFHARYPLRLSRSNGEWARRNPLVFTIRAALLGSLALTVVSAPMVPAHAADATASIAAERQFNIPAGSLSRAIDQFGTEAGLQISVEPALTENLTSKGLKGLYSVQSGLNVLLAGTGLVALHRGGDQYVLGKASARSGGGPESVAMLEPIMVTSRADRLPETYAGGQVARGGRVGMLGDQDFMDTPFSTTAYTERYIRDQQATDIGSVIGASDASVYVAQKRGVQESFLLRGFSVGGLNDVYFNGLAGMAPLMRGSTEMAERIEVQKGPAATLNGMMPDGSVGGSINLVAKRAGDEPLTRLTGTYESDSVFGLHADVGRRFGERKQFGIRFNGVIRDGDTAVDDQQHKMALGALALDWRGERVRLSADIYRQRERLDGINYFGISTIANEVTQLPKAFDGSTNLAPPWSFNINTTTAAMARAEWDLTDAVTAYAAYGRREGSYDTLVTSSSLLNDAGDIRTSINRQYYHQIVHSGEAGVNSTFATGPIDHAWSLAATAYEAEYGANAERAMGQMSNIYSLDYGPMPNFDAFSTATPPMLLRTKLNSVALADRMSFLGDRIQLTLGVRHQSVKSTPLTAYAKALASDYDKSVVSPTVALLFKPLEHLSVYGSYIQGLSQGGTAPATAVNAYEPLPPFKTKQYELGVKYDWGRFAATAALFQITRPSAYTDPATNIYAASGEQRNRGVEVNVFGEVSRGLRLLGGVSYTEATLRNQLNGMNNGNQATGTPKFIGRLGAEYDLPALQGMTLTGHVNHIGKRYVTADNRLSAPSYATLDVGARYLTRIGGKPVTLRAEVTNLTNKGYWTGTLGSGLGAPRTFMLSTTVDF